MKRSTITRSAHRLAVAAVAGAVVLAPVASVADDAAGSGADLAPQSEGTTTNGPEGEQTPPVGDAADTPAPGTETPDAPEGDAGTPGDEDEQEQPPVVDEDGSEDEDGDGDTAEEQPPTEDADSEDAESDADDEVQALEDVIEPDTGLGKYRQPVRVGSTLAEGTFVPAGTTTAGTVLRITESNPDFDEDLVRECTTEAETAVEGDPATFCVFDDQEFPDFPDGPVLPPEVRKQAVSPLSVVFPENPDEDQDEQAYAAERGSTVTVETVSLPDGLVADPEAAVVAPCPVLDDLTTFPPPNELRCTRQVALVEATGLPPVAQDDTATTQEDEPVVIDVLANDDPVAGAPIVDADLAALPENGEVRRIGAGAETRFEYTPADGFVGTDTFGYGFVTPNGVAFADVTITVEAGPEEATPIVPISNERAQLPDAGGPSQGLLGIAGALVAAGAVALGLGRRRGAEQH